MATTAIKEELTAELKDAMRCRDAARLAVIRQIKTDVARERSAAGFEGNVDDSLHARVIKAYVKKMTKARTEYEAAGERGVEMVASLTFEIDYLGRWLPQQLGEDQTRALVRDAIAALDSADVSIAGRMTGQLIKAHQGTVDGKLVARIVREELAAD